MPVYEITITEPDDDTLECPHCRNSISKGALVCTGCNAEISYRYGCPQNLKKGMSILCIGALILGGVIGGNTMGNNGIYLGLLTGGVCAIVCMFYATKDRVSTVTFDRSYLFEKKR